MSSNANARRMVSCPFSMCSGGQWCPHAVQVALATDCVGDLGRDESAIALQYVTIAKGVACTALEALG